MSLDKHSLVSLFFIVFQQCDERKGSTVGRHRSSAYNQDASQQKLLTAESVQRQRAVWWQLPLAQVLGTFAHAWGALSALAATNGVKVGFRFVPKHTPCFCGSSWMINFYWGVFFVTKSTRLIFTGYVCVCVCRSMWFCECVSIKFWQGQ